MQEEMGDTATPAASGASVFERPRGGRDKAWIKRLLSAPETRPRISRVVPARSMHMSSSLSRDLLWELPSLRTGYYQAKANAPRGGRFRLRPNPLRTGNYQGNLSA